MELLGEYAFNDYMGFFRNSDRRQRFVAGLLLALFALQSAQAFSCGASDLAYTAEPTNSEEMPCHGDDSPGHDGECCTSCVSMIPAVRLTPAAADLRQINITDSAGFDISIRPDLPYRPPNYHLS